MKLSSFLKELSKAGCHLHRHGKKHDLWLEAATSRVLVSSLEAPRMKEQTYTAVVKQESDGWIGWIEEVPGVNCQEPTRDELLDTLRVTLAEAIELNRAEARHAAGSSYEELPIAV